MDTSNMLVCLKHFKTIHIYSHDKMIMVGCKHYSINPITMKSIRLYCS